MYWRYSANSTLKPLNGLRWRPERNPSTTVRAFSSRLLRRATTAGSRNWRSRTLDAMLHPALRQRHGFEQPIDDGVRVDPFRLGVEIRHDAVPQNGLRQRLDVLHRHVITAVHQGARFSAAHEGLGGPKTSAPLHPLFDEVRRTLASGPRGIHKPDGVAGHFFGQHDLCHQIV